MNELGTPAIQLNNVCFRYATGGVVVDIPSLTVHGGERLFLHGPSGSGKTTLLGLLGGILRPTSGKVKVLGRDLNELGGHARDQFRGQHVGFIFQMFNLLPYLSVIDNIMLPCLLNKHRLAKIASDKPRDYARSMAEKIGLGAVLGKPVVDLSVGQQQRVAAVRAMMGRPEIIIADEPTSALDEDHRGKFIEMLIQLCQESEATLVFVSHDLTLRPFFSRDVSLKSINRAQA